MPHPVEDGATPSFRPLWRLMPYLWPKGRPDLKARVVLSILFLMLAIGVTTISQQFLGAAVDEFGTTPERASLMVVIALVAAYVLSRALMQAFAQLRDGIFAKVQYHAMREVAVETFAHVHTLSLRFHLERKTGGLSRTIERGTRGIDNILSFALFSIFPIVFQVLIYSAMLYWFFNIWVALTAIGMVAAYAWFTFVITRWRIAFRREMNQSDTDANTKAVDSLLNFETVKYFNNEGHETRRFDQSMERYSLASIQSQTSLSLLNSGQAAIMALGQGLVLVLAAMMVQSGEVKLGQFVAANLIVIQLYQPLNLLGTVYREITQGLVDMEAMFRLLGQPQEVQDRAGAGALAISGGEIRFDNVVFGYDPQRVVLKGISFTVPAGKTVAIVGPSGAGKSTISRILYRFYDIQDGAVTIDGQDIRDITQASLRAAIGIVPQDTVLFNDTVKYNIAYGRIGAGEDDIREAARLAQIDAFIKLLPLGYESMGQTIVQLAPSVAPRRTRVRRYSSLRTTAARGL